MYTSADEAFVTDEFRDVASRLPLSPVEYHVLLVLAGDDLYGYAIRQAVARESGGAVCPEIGSLYRVLARLLDSGLVSETEAPTDAPAAHRGRDRKYYALTPDGREVLKAETSRLRAVLAVARERNLIPEAPTS